MAKEMLYLKIDSNTLIHQKHPVIKEIAEIACSNRSLKNRVMTLKLENTKITEPGRYVLSIVEVIEVIQKEFPELEIQNLGETDFILTYEEEKKKGKAMAWIKTIVVSILSFFGAAFSIMTFHNDVDLRGLFADIYQLFTNQTSDGFTILELSYSFGLGLGIILFFNHFAGKRIETDPTPLDVQMHTYEEDINQTIMANQAAREQKEKQS